MSTKFDAQKFARLRSEREKHQKTVISDDGVRQQNSVASPSSLSQFLEIKNNKKDSPESVGGASIFKFSPKDERPSLNRLRSLNRSVSAEVPVSTKATLIQKDWRHMRPPPLQPFRRSQSLKGTSSPHALRALSLLSRKHPEPLDSKLTVPDQVIVSSKAASTPLADEESWTSGSNSSRDGLLQLGHLIMEYGLHQQAESSSTQETPPLSPPSASSATEEIASVPKGQGRTLYTLVRFVQQLVYYMFLCVCVLSIWIILSRNNGVDEMQMQSQPPRLPSQPKKIKSESYAGVSDDRKDQDTAFEPMFLCNSLDNPFKRARSDLDAVFATLYRNLQHQEAVKPELEKVVESELEEAVGPELDILLPLDDANTKVLQKWESGEMGFIAEPFSPPDQTRINRVASFLRESETDQSIILPRLPPPGSKPP